MFERGMQVRLRDRLWEIEDVRGGEKETFLDLRRADDRPGPRRLKVLAAAEPTLKMESTKWKDAHLSINAFSPLDFELYPEEIEKMTKEAKVKSEVLLTLSVYQF
ncbi:hypothetical protein [Streptosporangium sp. NPDC087985]|uniref:hypothetical protein n=1 Tax=Streptosporangium sp. NPDC087985 TaxID=3366196 RepID=UPI0038201D47